MLAVWTDIAQVVNDSASANVAQLVGTQEGVVVVQSYNWTGMFAGHIQKLKHVKQYHFDASMHGAVSFKRASDSEEDTIVLLTNRSWSPSS